MSEQLMSQSKIPSFIDTQDCQMNSEISTYFNSYDENTNTNSNDQQYFESKIDERRNSCYKLDSMMVDEDNQHTTQQQQKFNTTQAYFENTTTSQTINSSQKQQNNKSILPKTDKEYTIVLDLDNTLIHTKLDDSQNAMLYYRPHMTEFLMSIAAIAEIVIFTASTLEYAKCIAKKIDPSGTLISHIVARDHITSYISENNTVEFFKDLSILGRNLNKTLLIDDKMSNFKKQPENGIRVEPWYVNMENSGSDIELLKISQFIQLFVGQNMDIQTLIQNSQSN